MCQFATQIRIEQVITTSLPLVSCFKLSQLLAFYGRTVEQMMGGHAHLTQTLAECHKLATRIFHEQLKARSSKLLQQTPAPTAQLSVPPQVRLSRLLLLNIDGDSITCFVRHIGASQLSSGRAVG